MIDIVGTEQNRWQNLQQKDGVGDCPHDFHSRCHTTGCLVDQPKEYLRPVVDWSWEWAKWILGVLTKILLTQILKI